MTRLLRAEWIKTTATRSTWVIAAVTVAACTGITLLQLGLDTGTDGSELRWGNTASRFATVDDVVGVVDLVGVVGLVALLLGALSLPTEFRYETIAPTFLTTPSVPRILAAKAVAVGVVGAALAVACQAAVLAVTAGWLTLIGAGVPLGGDLVPVLVLTPVAAALAAVVGLGIGAAARQQVTALVAVAGWVVIVEQLVAGLVPSVRNVLPFTGAVTALGSAGTPDLAVGAAAALLVGYAALAVALGGRTLATRDIA